MNKTTIIYIILIIFTIYLLLNLKPFREKFTQTSVPSPSIYLPLTLYRNVRYAVDNNKMPVIIDGLSNLDFDSNKGVFFDGSNNKYIMISDLSGNYTICFNLYVTNIVPNTFIFNQGQLPFPPFNFSSIPASQNVLKKDPRILYYISDNGFTDLGVSVTRFPSATQIILDSREPAFNNTGNGYPAGGQQPLPVIGSPINGPFIQSGTTVVSARYISLPSSPKYVAGILISISQPLSGIREKSGDIFIYTFPMNFQQRNGMGLSVKVKDENNLRLDALDPSSKNDTTVDGTVSLLNKWNFVCITVSGSTQSSLWINGKEYRKSLNIPWQLGKFIIGGQLTNGNSFTGYVRDFMTFSSTLSYNQINSLNAVAQQKSVFEKMFSYIPPIIVAIPQNIVNSVLFFDSSIPIINPSNSIDDYTNYISLMNPIELKDNQLKIEGSIINLDDLSIFNNKLKVVINLNNSLDGPRLYALLNNTNESKIYNPNSVYLNTYKLSIDQINDLSSTIQYVNIVLSNPTITLCDTLTDKKAITFAINPFKITPTYTNPSQFKIIDNTNFWNKNLGSLNLSITYINNILTCQKNDTIQLINFTSIEPLTLSYNGIVINKFNSSLNGLFTLDPITIPTISPITYKISKFTLKNVKLSSPDMSTPLAFLDILITPIYT
jgi:hypothetical protein